MCFPSIILTRKDMDPVSASERRKNALKGIADFYLGAKLLIWPYRGTSLIRCGDSENACYFLTQTRNFKKTLAYFLRN